MRRRHLSGHARVVGLALLAALLAGCTARPKEPAPASPAPPPAPVAETEPAPEPPPPPPPPEPDPQRLLGWTPAAVTALFGKPDLVRWEGPVQIYLYPDPAAGCALTMIFREQDGAFHLESLIAHDPAAPDHQPLASKPCLARLLPQRLWPRLAPEGDGKEAAPDPQEAAQGAMNTEPAPGETVAQEAPRHTAAQEDGMEEETASPPP